MSMKFLSPPPTPLTKSPLNAGQRMELAADEVDPSHPRSRSCLQSRSRSNNVEGKARNQSIWWCKTERHRTRCPSLKGPTGRGQWCVIFRPPARSCRLHYQNVSRCTIRPADNPQQRNFRALFCSFSGWICYSDSQLNVALFHRCCCGEGDTFCDELGSRGFSDGRAVAKQS